MILVCYDGSPDSKAAVERGAELVAGQPATVLTVWQPFTQVLARTPAGLGLAPGIVDIEEIDEAASKSAEGLADDGAQLATDAGLNAQPRTCSQTTTAEAILTEAEAVGASAPASGCLYDRRP